MDSQNFIYIADIGGTNARFALAKQTPTGQLDIEYIKVFPTSDFANFTDAFIDYSDYLKTDCNLKQLPINACIAIAAIIEHDAVQMTSLDWQFSKTQLKKDLSLKQLEVINDFASLAMSVPFIPDNDLSIIKTGQAIANKPRVILGPGTGLGSAALIPAGDKWIPVAAQGGHVNFAPTSELETSLLSLYRAKLGYVSFETFVCGSGLANIFAGLTALKNQTELTESSLTPAQISQEATNNTNPLAVTTLDLFFSFLGRFTGNLALTCGATGGVYLAGGILPRLETPLLKSNFITQFEQKGISSPFVDDIPIYLIKHSQPALIGAAAYFFERYQ